MSDFLAVDGSGGGGGSGGPTPNAAGFVLQASYAITSLWCWIESASATGSVLILPRQYREIQTVEDTSGEPAVFLPLYLPTQTGSEPAVSGADIRVESRYIVYGNRNAEETWQAVAETVDGRNIFAFGTERISGPGVLEDLGPYAEPPDPGTPDWAEYLAALPWLRARRMRLIQAPRKRRVLGGLFK